MADLVEGREGVVETTKSGGTGLRFAVLGPLEVTRWGERLQLGGRQQRAILALLLAESGTVVSVGRLGDSLWGQNTPSGFVTTVQTYVFRLRQILEPDRERGASWKVLVTEPTGYRLDAGGSIVDATIFAASVHAGRDALDRHAYEGAAAELTRALGLWRGEVLADVADLGFVKPVAARLEAMRMIAQGLRIEAELALGRHASALPEIDRMVAEHPLQEQLHEQRMTALYRLGRQSDALAAYREVRGRLHQELGIEPGRRLQQLHQAVLAQDPVLDWRPLGAGQSTVPRLSPVPRVSSTVPSAQSTAPFQPAPMDEEEPPPPTASPPPAASPTSPASPASPANPASSPGLLGGSGRPLWAGRRFQVVSAATVVLLAGSALTVLVGQWSHSPPSSFLPNSVGSINEDGSIGESVKVGLSPDGLTYGAGSLWAANREDGTVSRINPDTRAVVETIPVGTSPTALTWDASDPNDVWVVTFGDGKVSRVNTVTNTVVQRIPVGNQPTAIASGRSGVWVANSGDGTIQRIDPKTGLAGKVIEVGDSPSGIAVDATSVWVCSDVEGTVSEIDPVTGQQVNSVFVGGGPRGIALIRGNVWVASQLSQIVTRIQRTTDAVQQITVGDGPNSLQEAGGSVWVSNEYDGYLARIDPSSNQVSRVFLGASPRGLAVDAGGKLWVASGAFADVKHIGGTLRVVGATIPGGQGVIDPAAVNDPTTQAAERFVYDGLVALGMSGGAASQSLVPDLAVRLPTLSNGNRTYTFTLRSGRRYSTGREVHASDFRTGVLKALTVGGNPEYFAGIVGGRTCIDHPASCDLKAGLITNDAKRRVTFNLVAPDPQFLPKLASFVYPVPPGTGRALSGRPVPGTGPYLIDGRQTTRQLILRRNPHFSRWSFAAQPDGYPDVIEFRQVADGKTAADQVLDGRADVAGLDPSTAALRDGLARRYPDKLKKQQLSQADFEQLNTGRGNAIATTLISARVGNYQSSPTLGPILSQLWVR